MLFPPIVIGNGEWTISAGLIDNGPSILFWKNGLFNVPADTKKNPDIAISVVSLEAIQLLSHVFKTVALMHTNPEQINYVQPNNNEANGGLPL